MSTETLETVEYKESQCLHIRQVNGTYSINKVTDKAILLEMDNGRWLSNSGFTPLWVPKSIIDYVRFNDSKDNSQYGIHVVNIPEWFINQHSKKW